MDLTNLHWLSASDAARLIRDGVVGSAELVQACLARVRETDAQVQAWAFLDPDHALAQARAADELRLSGQPVGPLHGVPVGIKDIIDTADMPTENGSVLCAGRTPSRDASVVRRRLRPEAAAWPRPAPRDVPALAHARPCRPVRARHRGSRAPHGAGRRLRRA